MYHCVLHIYIYVYIYICVYIYMCMYIYRNVFTCSSTRGDISLNSERESN